MIHIKKTWPDLFQKILEGKKNFECRLADWECKEGDVLVLKEWDQITNEYTGRELKKEVTYVGLTKDFDFWSKEKVEKYGYQVIAFK